MIKPIRFNPGDPLTRELIDSHALAIGELQAIAGGELPDHRDVEQAMVYVKNNTGGRLTKGAVVGLGDPVYSDPTGNERMFLHGELVFAGDTPAEGTHEGKFAVLDQAIGDGNSGVACIQGVVRVKVKIDDADVADWADIDDGETGNLLAAASGSARILWREGSGTGTVWAVCLIGAGGEDVKVRVSTDDTRAAALRSTAAELAEDPPKPHKIVGDNEAHLPSCGAGAGWIEAEMLGADDENQQLLIRHVGPGPSCYTYPGDLCGVAVRNIDVDAKGHLRSFNWYKYGNCGNIGPCI